MAVIYVRSTDGSDSDNGSTWALAKATLAGAAAAAAAGDTIYVSHQHSESPAANTSISLAGTRSAPVRVLCVNDGAEPPTALATTAVIAPGSGYWFAISGSAYVYGIEFKPGGAIYLNNSEPHEQFFDACKFTLNTSSTDKYVSFTLSNFVSPLKTTARDCTFTFGRGDYQGVILLGDCRIVGGSFINSGGFNQYTALFLLHGSGEGATALVEGVDFSGCGTSAWALVFPATGYGAPGTFVVRNCKMPSGWAGSLCTPTGTTFDYHGWRAKMHNCDSGDTNYRLREQDWAGSVREETTIVRTGGASDGTTALAWKLASSSWAMYPHRPFESPEIVQWNETTGSAITVAVEIVTDGVTLKDDECWLEVQYLGTSGVPMSSTASDAKADVLASAANQTTSSASWTTTGLASPVKQQLAVTITPQEKGYLHAVVKLAKASTTVYVDPLLTVS